MAIIFFLIYLMLPILYLYEFARLMLLPYILYMVIVVIYVLSLAGTGHSHGTGQTSLSNEIGLAIFFLVPALCIFCVTRTEKYKDSKKNNDNPTKNTKKRKW